MDDVDALVVAVGGGAGWHGVQTCGDGHGGNVAHGHGVDSVDDVWPARELDASLEHAHEEVVVVADAGGGVAEDIAWTDNGAEKSASACFADELFGYL